MTPNAWLGAVAVAVGIALLVFGINATNAPLESISETLTGRYTNSTMWLIIGGIGALVGGFVLVGTARR